MPEYLSHIPTSRFYSQPSLFRSTENAGLNHAYDILFR